MQTMTKYDKETRSDGEITRDVWRRMKADLTVPDDRIGIKTQNGIVTIVGTVVRAAHKAAAEACALDVDGVRGVNNKVEVDRVFTDQVETGG